MNNIDKLKEYNVKIDDLIQTVIINYSEYIDFNNEKELYNRLIYLLSNGQLNDEFNSEHLMNLTQDEKEKILNLVNKYSSLCFKDKNFCKWNDSCQEVVKSDYRYICIKIIDNYDFLIDITKLGGERVLDLLNQFENYYNFDNSSVIEVIRNKFNNDEIAKSILIDMSLIDSKFNIFSTEQKAFLCLYPDCLYEINDGKVIYRAPNSIALDIYRYIYKNEDRPTLNELELGIKTISNFDNVLFDMINSKETGII